MTRRLIWRRLPPRVSCHLSRFREMLALCRRSASARFRPVTSASRRMMTRTEFSRARKESAHSFTTTTRLTSRGPRSGEEVCRAFPLGSTPQRIMSGDKLETLLRATRSRRWRLHRSKTYPSTSLRPTLICDRLWKSPRADPSSTRKAERCHSCPPSDPLPRSICSATCL